MESKIISITKNCNVYGQSQCPRCGELTRENKELKIGIKRLIFAIERLEGQKERDNLTDHIIKETWALLKREGLL